MINAIYLTFNIIFHHCGFLWPNYKQSMNQWSLWWYGLDHAGLLTMQWWVNRVMQTYPGLSIIQRLPKTDYMLCDECKTQRQLLNHSTSHHQQRHSLLSRLGCWQFSGNVTPRTVTAASYNGPACRVLSLKLTLTSIPQCPGCQLIWQGLGCWAAGLAACLGLLTAWSTLTLGRRFVYSGPTQYRTVQYGAVQCSTVGLLVQHRWAGLGWWLGPHSGSGPARRVMQPPAGVNIITTF